MTGMIYGISQRQACSYYRAGQQTLHSLGHCGGHAARADECPTLHRPNALGASNCDNARRFVRVHAEIPRCSRGLRVRQRRGDAVTANRRDKLRSHGDAVSILRARRTAPVSVYARSRGCDQHSVSRRARAPNKDVRGRVERVAVSRSQQTIGSANERRAV